jgi:Protein of unknown function (DUF4054)
VPIAPADLAARFPEFGPTVTDFPAAVQAAIDEAYIRCDARVFNTRIDDAAAYMAAHLLSISSYGQQARLQSDKASSTYLAEWERLAQSVAVGPWAVGQLPGAGGIVL